MDMALVIIGNLAILGIGCIMQIGGIRCILQFGLMSVLFGAAATWTWSTLLLKYL